MQITRAALTEATAKGLLREEQSEALWSFLAARERPDRVKVVYQSEKGIVPSRRAAVAAASGEICAFLDADDTMEKECLAVIASRFAADPGLDILLYNYHVMSGDGRQRAAAPALYADGAMFFGEGKRALYEELVRSWKLNPLWKNLSLQVNGTEIFKNGGWRMSLASIFYK